MLDHEELERLKKMSLFEERLKKRGYFSIAGVDEAGRGPLAGPVVACACILPEGALIEHVNDSKKLTKSKREVLFNKLTTNKDVYYGIGIVDQKRIDEINIFQASLEAMLIAINNLPKKADFLLFDGKFSPTVSIPSQAIVKGDSLSISIASASIIAKYTRDAIMEEYHTKYPEYGFSSHKGYGTKKHLEAIEKHGPCEIHRKTFDPIKSMLEKIIKL